MDAVGSSDASPIPCARWKNSLALYRVQMGLFLSERMIWRYSRDFPVFGSIIVLANPFGMCDVGVVPGGVIGRLDWSWISAMWLAKLNSKSSRAFTAIALNFGGPVQLRVRYRLGGGLVSGSSSFFALKVGLVGLLSGTTVDRTRVTEFTLVGGAGVLHGATLAGAARRESLG